MTQTELKPVYHRRENLNPVWGIFFQQFGHSVFCIIKRIVLGIIRPAICIGHLYFEHVNFFLYSHSTRWTGETLA